MTPTKDICCAPGTKIYIPCTTDVWRTAEVVSVEKEIVVKIENTGESVVLSDKDVFHICNTDVWNTTGLSAPSDLTLLTHLHEASVLDSLHIRFDVDNIYTFTGPILIAVNPFKQIAGLYDDETLIRFIERFRTEPVIAVDKSIMDQGDTKLPHVFAVSKGAYDGLCKSQKSQTILISGESGAGKTESTKFVMKYLTCAGSEHIEKRSEVELQVLESNPLLEAFGNARTLRNDNSSRFGKFIELQFNLIKDRELGILGRLCGASICTYLLEKVRVGIQQEGERNFHIFYQLCAAAKHSRGGKFVLSLDRFPRADKTDTELEFDLSMLGDLKDYRILTQSTCTTLSGVDDRVEFENTLYSMKTLGISHSDIMHIINIVTAIMNIGNIEFSANPSASDSTVVSKPASQAALKLAAELLHVKEATLLESLCFRTIKTAHESYQKALEVNEAFDTRDSLCRALYGCLFMRMVSLTNRRIEYEHKEDTLFCGVLDIFGFECFKVNSFEQLCINYTNERLQQFFNTFVFKCEEALYKQECIRWDPLDFPDNQDCVLLLQSKPNGIFAMLDEECIVPGGKDKGFNHKIVQKFTGHLRFSPVKLRQNCFVINHFAGAVEYMSDGFMEKNRDQISHDLQCAIVNSSQEFVSALFKDFLPGCTATQNEDKMLKRRTVTVSSEFRDQLASLMEKVDSTAPHFIRCIKPNTENAPDIFDRMSVNEQLRYGGVLQAVQVSRGGFPVRGCHRDTFLDYKALATPTVLKKILDDFPATGESGSMWKSRAEALLKHLDSKYTLRRRRANKDKESKAATADASEILTWAVGNTLCFFKNESYEVLSTELNNLRKKCATALQATFKGFIQRREYLYVRSRIILIQKHIRGALARRLLIQLLRERAASRIQSYMRSFCVRVQYLQLRRAAICIQAHWHGKKDRELFKQLYLHRAASRIQAAYRMYRAHSYYVRLRAGAIMAQLKWKKIVARRMVRKLRQEAKEINGLLARAQQMQVEINVARERRSELETQVDTLQAKNEDLKRQLAVTTSDLEHTQSELSKVLASNDSLMKQLQSFKKMIVEGATADSAGDGTAEKETDSAGSSRAPTVAPTPTAILRKFARGQSQSDLLIAQSTAAAHRNDEDVKALKLAIQNRERNEAKRFEKQKQQNDELRSSLEEVQKKLDQEIALRKEAEEKYRLVLEDSATRVSAPTTAMPRALQSQSHAHHHGEAGGGVCTAGGVGGAVGTAAGATDRNRSGSLGDSHSVALYNPRWIDLLLLGGEGAGKTGLIEQFLVDVKDEPRLHQLRDAKVAERDCGKSEQLYRIQRCPNKIVTCVDIPGMGIYGKSDIEGRVRQANAVAIVFDPTIEKTWLDGVSLFENVVKPILEDMVATGIAVPQVYFVENHWRLVSGNHQLEVDQSVTRDTVAGFRCRYMNILHMSNLVDEITPVTETINAAQPAGTKMAFRRMDTFMHENVIDIAKQAGAAGFTGSLSEAWLKNLRNLLSTPGQSAATAGKTVRSTKATKFLLPSMEPDPNQPVVGDGPTQDVFPVTEIYDMDSPLTCLVFGKERSNIDYVLLAAASKEGMVIIYRCYRTLEERRMFSENRDNFFCASSPNGDEKLPDENKMVLVHSVLKGNTRAVTSMFFTLLDDHLVTTSIDKTVRFWRVDTGEMIKVFTDSAAALSAAFLPFNPTVFIASNANSVLRLVCSDTGKVLQKLKVESEVRALRFDDTGLFCFAGTKVGTIHVLEATDNLKMKFNAKHIIGRGAITCISFVPSHSPTHHPCLLVNICDNFIAVLDCVYGHPSGTLANLLFRHRIKIKHAALPLRSCYSPAGGEWVVSGSESKSVVCFPMYGNSQKSDGFTLDHHQAPVLAVAVNSQNTLLASCDSVGLIVLWRRMIRR